MTTEDQIINLILINIYLLCIQYSHNQICQKSKILNYQFSRVEDSTPGNGLEWSRLNSSGWDTYHSDRSSQTYSGRPQTGGSEHEYYQAGSEVDGSISMVKPNYTDLALKPDYYENVNYQGYDGLVQDQHELDYADTNSLKYDLHVRYDEDSSNQDGPHESTEIHKECHRAPTRDASIQEETDVKEMIPEVKNDEMMDARELHDEETDVRYDNAEYVACDDCIENVKEDMMDEKLASTEEQDGGQQSTQQDENNTEELTTKGNNDDEQHKDYEAGELDDSHEENIVEQDDDREMDEQYEHVTTPNEDGAVDAVVIAEYDHGYDNDEEQEIGPYYEEEHNIQREEEYYQQEMNHDELEIDYEEPGVEYHQQEYEVPEIEYEEPGIGYGEPEVEFHEDYGDEYDLQDDPMNVDCEPDCYDNNDGNDNYSN